MQVWAIWRTSVRYELEANQAVAGTIHGHAEGHESAWSESVQRTSKCVLEVHLANA